MGKILDAFAADELCVNPSTYSGNPEDKKTIDTMYKIAEALERKLGSVNLI